MHRIYGPCDFFCVQTILFETFYVFFVIRHANREILHVGVTRYPTAEWAAQQIVECCAWDRWPPRFLIHDRDSRYGMTFDTRLRRLGIKQIRTPYRSPRANAVTERWVNWLGPNALITSLSSARRVCDETYPRTFLTSIFGGRIDRSDNGHRAIQKKLGLRLSGSTERSSQTLYSVACTTSISSQHDTFGRVLAAHLLIRELRLLYLLVSPWATPKIADRIFAPYRTAPPVHPSLSFDKDRSRVSFQEQLNEEPLNPLWIVGNLVITRREWKAPLQPVERRLTGDRRAIQAPWLHFASQHRHDWVVAQLIVVIQVFVAERQSRRPADRPASRPRARSLPRTCSPESTPRTDQRA